MFQWTEDWICNDKRVNYNNKRVNCRKRVLNILTRRDFKVRRLHKLFLTRFGGRDMHRTRDNPGSLESKNFKFGQTRLTTKSSIASVTTSFFVTTCSTWGRDYKKRKAKSVYPVPILAAKPSEAGLHTRLITPIQAVMFLLYISGRNMFVNSYNIYIETIAVKE